jgi:hypothetical protein
MVLTVQGAIVKFRQSTITNIGPTPRLTIHIHPLLFTCLQKRAVVLEPHERKAVALLNQLNAIRNAKASKRREANDRRAAVKAKQAEKEQGWRDKLNKERRKDR